MIELLVILVLILANGVFAAAEIAIVSARKGRLEQQAQAGQQGATAALALAEQPNHFLSTVQVGITVIGTCAAAVGGASLADALARLLTTIPALASHAQSVALSLVVALISYLSLILGELVPKRLALQNAEGIAIRLAPMMRLLARLVGPVVSFLTASTELVLRLLGRHDVAETPVTEDDVLALVREGAAEGTLDATEQDLIANVFTFTDRSVRSLMQPRTQMVAVEIATPLPIVLQIVTESGYSRLPVYAETLDRIAGILFAKDLLHAWGQAESITMGSLLREPVYLLESQRAVVAFQQLKQCRCGLAVVLDEYGQVAGLITMEDFIEELVGDIHDEYDQPDTAVVQREDGSYLVDGLLPFVELQERLALPDVGDTVREQDFETVAGLLLVLLGRIPTVGDTVHWADYILEVVDMDGQRIDKILLRSAQPQAGEQVEGVLAHRAALAPAGHAEQQPGHDRAGEGGDPHEAAGSTPNSIT